MVGTKKANMKQFKGASNLRYRLVLSTLSSTPIRLTHIRDTDSTSPGLSPSEISFIRLLDKLTSGAIIQINETGTTLTYTPGLLVGTSNERLIHDCHPSRAISYYLEPLLMISPFCKNALNVQLKGPTHSEMDICIDTVSTISIPLLRRLTKKSSLSPSLQIKRKSCMSKASLNGGGKEGHVNFRCDVLTGKLHSIDMIDTGVVKRIRGIAYGNRVNPGYINRMIDEARGVLNNFSPDIYIHSDHNNFLNCGVGFSLQLVAESDDNVGDSMLGSDWSCCGKSNIDPERVSRVCCDMLLEEIENGGCIDSNHVCVALLFAALADSDLSRIRIGKLSDAAVTFVRDVETFFGVRFNVRLLGGSTRSDSDDEDDEMISDNQDGHGIVMSCIGVGLSNIARQRF